MLDQIVSLGAAEIAQQIRGGQTTPQEVVEAFIEQIEKVNPRINALVTPTFEQARDEARIAGVRLARKEANLPPLFGVPVTIKDALPVAGIRFTAGSIHYRDQIAKDDADAVSRLKEAGAIILGKTNCADMSGSTETNNLVFGLTKNPWNLAHSAGGSSGGEGALIAARGSPLGLGSDIAGSIRIPAAFCGIVGLKPTAGRIPTGGHVPPTPDLISSWNTVGPLARCIEDLALVLSVLSNTPTRDFRAIELENCQILVPEFLAITPVSREIANAIHGASDALAGCGMQVIKRVKLPLLKVSFEYIAIMYREWLPQYRLLLGNGEAVSLIPELIANWKGKGQVSASTLALLATVGMAGPPSSLLGYGQMEQLDELQSQIHDRMGPGGLMIWPVFPTPAPKHGFAWHPDKAPIYTCIINCLGFPSVSLPIGLSKDNLPLSIQIIGRPNEDETVLAVAALLEREFGGCSTPPS